MTGTQETCPALDRYLLATIATGVAVSIAGLATGGITPSATLIVQIVLLVGLGALAERFTLYLTHHTHINTATAIYIAMVLTLPPHLVPVVALLTALLGQVSRQRGDRVETAFNATHVTLSVGLAVAAYGWLVDLPSTGPDLAGFGGVGALLLTAMAYHGVSTLMVAVAAGLQLGTSIPRTWRGTLTEGLVIEAALAALGLVAAVLLRDSPVLLPVLVLPALVLHRALQELVRLRLDTHAALAELVEVVELRDPYTAGHSRRVAALGHRLAVQMGLTYEEADLIASAGKVHDLGKVAVDPAVLMKPGALTDEEFAEMQRHPALSGQVVAKFAAYGDGWLLVRHHHERLDGKGYPDGLAGEEIPLGARILAVADTFDALTSARPYRQPRTTAFALGVLREGSGTQHPGGGRRAADADGGAGAGDGPGGCVDGSSGGGDGGGVGGIGEHPVSLPSGIGEHSDFVGEPFMGSLVGDRLLRYGREAAREPASITIPAVARHFDLESGSP